MRRYALLLAALLATACAPQRPHFRHGGMGPRPGMGMGMGARNLFVSPAGEPFRAAPGAPAPMRAWFDAADTDHDGALSWAEFEGDFTRYFAILDADHDGEIGPAEVTRYETEILPEMASRGGAGGFGGGGGGFRGGGMGRGGGGMGRRGGGMGRGGGSRPSGAGGLPMMAGAARFGLLPIPHPIMAADDDFNRGVSLAEFRHAAAQRFEMLDDAHNGRLTFAELAQRRIQFYGGRGRRGSEGAAPPPPPGE